MSKELAQAVGGRKVAWLIALLAAIAVVATLGSQWRGSEAAMPTTSFTLSQNPPTPGPVNPGDLITYTTDVDTTGVNSNGPVVITIILPTGVQATTSTVTCPSPAGGVNWAAGGAGTGILTCTSSGALTSNLTNYAMVVTVNAAASDQVGTASGSIADADNTPIAATAGAGLGTLTINGVTASGGGTVAPGTPAITFTFTIPSGLDVCGEDSNLEVDTYVPTASDFVITNGTFVSATTDGGNPNVVTVTVQPTVGVGSSVSVAILTHLATSTVTEDCQESPPVTTQVAQPAILHIADDGNPIVGQEVSNNVRGSTHTICVVADDTGTISNGVFTANPTPLVLPGLTLANIVVTNGGGYTSTADTDPTFSDVQIFVGDGNNGLDGATCISWRSLDAGDQTISLTYVDGNTSQNVNVFWDNRTAPNSQGIVKEWNRLEASTITSGSATGTGANVSITRNLPLVLNPLNGQYQGTPVTITDTFLGSHTNSAGQQEGPMPLAGVNWNASLATGSCGNLTGTTAGTTTLTNTGGVGGTPNLTFNPSGCAPGSTATVTITGSEPGALGSGTPTTVTQSITFTFTAQIPAKHVFLAWAGQRVVLEHNWALDPDQPGQTCPEFGEGQSVRYVKSSGPGAFLPGGTVLSILDQDHVVASVTTQNLNRYAPCTSVAVYESEDQGQVDIEAFIENAPASKVAFVVYYMKINTVNVSLVTQASKPTHNGSAAPDWTPGNPWDASKDDADGTAEWNVSKDILVRGRVTGWFTNSNPSGRPADTSNPLNVLPADRWVMPNDWPVLAGGPADPADGSNAIGTAEQFRPYYDIMIDPDMAKNGGRALANPNGLGLTQVAAVAAGNTGVGSATSPIIVTTCASLQANDNISVGATSKTVSSCTGTALVLTVPFTTAPAAGTPIFESSGTPFVGPYSALDIVGLSQDGFGTLAPTDPTFTARFRDTAWRDGDVDWWDAPMPPALVSVQIRGTGFIKQVIKSDVYYVGTPNTLSVAGGGTQVYPNPFYWSEIPESPAISAVAAGGGYLWDSFGTNGPADGPYAFWTPVLVGTNSAGIGEALSSTDVAELNVIRSVYGDNTIARDLVVYSDNHGEFMVAANGDFKTDLSACATNALAGGKHCKPGDKVGSGRINATVDYPDFRGKHFPVLSNTVTVEWTWGGYKDVTVHDGETDQFKYVVFHALDRDGFCSVPAGAVSLHPVLSGLSTDSWLGYPPETVDFLIDSGEGIIVGQSGGGTINDGRRFATGVTTFSVALNNPAVTGIKEFPLSPLAASGQTDECQAWIKVSNSLLGIVNVLAIAHDDEGDIGFDRVIDLATTTSYTLNFRWSLITWAGADNIPVLDALKGTGKNTGGNDISSSVTAVYGWNAAAQQWLGFFPAGVNVPGANDLTSLKTGEAYWIAITGPSSVTWTIATNVD
ncbi:hypothetical protein, partial [Tepidiforma sp.]|uniref:hypothetical protein n=1 Tax=Tepidiforma sp. TaxID=2682230 RepID=UPI002ADE3D93